MLLGSLHSKKIFLKCPKCGWQKEMKAVHLPVRCDQCNAKIVSFKIGEPLRPDPRNIC